MPTSISSSESEESPINDEGFLSEHIEPFRQRIRQNHQNHWELVFEINKYCQRVKFQMLVHNRDGQQIFCAALFIKLLGDVQATVLLLERGLSSQARSLLRIALEALIILGKLSRSYEFLEAFVRLGEQQRLRMVRAIHRNPAPALDSIRLEITEEVIQRIEHIVGDIPCESLEQWARELGFSHFYDAQYRLYSNDVHSKPRALEHYLETNADGEYAVINWGPDISKDLTAELLGAAHLLTYALSFVRTVFELQIADDIDAFLARIVALDSSSGGTSQLTS